MFHRAESKPFAVPRRSRALGPADGKIPAAPEETAGAEPPAAIEAPVEAVAAAEPTAGEAEATEPAADADAGAAVEAKEGAVEEEEAAVAGEQKRTRGRCVFSSSNIVHLRQFPVLDCYV